MSFVECTRASIRLASIWLDGSRIKEELFDPLGQPTVTAGSDQYFQTYVVRKHVRKLINVKWN